MLTERLANQRKQAPGLLIMFERPGSDTQQNLAVGMYRFRPLVSRVSPRQKGGNRPPRCRALIPVHVERGNERIRILIAKWENPVRIVFPPVKRRCQKTGVVCIVEREGPVGIWRFPVDRRDEPSVGIFIPEGEQPGGTDLRITILDAGQTTQGIEIPPALKHLVTEHPSLVVPQREQDIVFAEIPVDREEALEIV